MGGEVNSIREIEHKYYNVLYNVLLQKKKQRPLDFGNGFKYIVILRTSRENE